MKNTRGPVPHHKHHAYSLKGRNSKKDPFDNLGANPTLSEIKSAVADASMEELEDRINDVRESWETESLFEDVINEQEHGDEKSVFEEIEACRPEEAAVLRQQLRDLGPLEFCKRTVDSGVYTAKKLLTAFGIRPPPFLEGSSDEAYFSILTLAMSRELSKRAKLTRYNTVDDAVNLLKSSRNIIVLTGAGISTSLGIPDFRSKGTGLYSKLEHLGLSDPQEVFDIDQFREDPTIFYSVARDILPSTTRFTPTHAFIALLQNQGRLLTNYTQNIDNLETYAGIRKEKMVQCHGSFGTATCQLCRFQTRGDKIFPDIRAGRIPRCPRCEQNARAAAGPVKRKRSHGIGGARRKRWGASNLGDDSTSDSEYDLPGANVGIMKPDITFFGEPLPDEFSKRLTEHDREKVDLVVVIGTSLKVTPVSEIVSWLPPHIPQIYISKTPITHINFDVDLLGDCDVVVAELCRRAGWDLSHDMIPRGQRVKVVQEDGFTNRWTFTDVKKEEEAKKTLALREAAVVAATTEEKKIVNGLAANGMNTPPAENGKEEILGRRSARSSPRGAKASKSPE